MVSVVVSAEQVVVAKEAWTLSTQVSRGRMWSSRIF